MGRHPAHEPTNHVICKCGARFLKVSDFTEHMLKYRLPVVRQGRTPKSTVYINSLHGVDTNAMLDDFEDKETKR